MNAPPRVRRPWAALVRLHRAEGGQAIFAMIVFFFLLAGLAFLILNAGMQQNHKVRVQSAADSVTAGGAAWYARGLNVVSMANVMQTQLMSMVLMLDTLETVVPPATECIDDLVQNLGSSAAGRDISLDDRIKDWLAVGNARSEQEIIHQFEDVVEGIPMPDYCRYDDGVLWELSKLMEGFKTVMVRVTPHAAQREAIDIADENQMDFGFVVPIWPELPVGRGRFEDFRNPMQWARMPDPRDDEIIGGFAHVMGYRGYHGRILGPFEFWREPYLKTRPMGLFDISRFSVLFRIVSDMKLEMLFGSTEDEVTLRDWVMPYDEAKDLTDEEVLRAWWERLRFDSRYEFGTSAFWSNMDWRHEKRPFPSMRHYGSMDRPNLSGYTRGTQAWEGTDSRHAVWYKSEERWTAHYPQLGIYAPHPPTYPDGTPWPYTQAEKKKYYHNTFWRFDGAEREVDDHLHRDYLPPAGSPPDMAPILLNPGTGSWTTANISARFTFNGFAYRSGAVEEWTERFSNPNPSEEMIGYAQARVYNRWSHDLFTQDWKVKLVRQDRWKALIPRLNDPVPADGSDVRDALNTENIEPIRKMLGAYDDPFVEEVTH